MTTPMRRVSDHCPACNLDWTMCRCDEACRYCGALPCECRSVAEEPDAVETEPFLPGDGEPLDLWEEARQAAERLHADGKMSGFMRDLIVEAAERRGER